MIYIYAVFIDILHIYLTYSQLANIMVAVNLKPQDVVVLLKLIAQGHSGSCAALADQLYISPSEVHAALKRATEAGLLDPVQRMPIRKALEEFLVHGLKYVYPPKRGSLTRGVLTAYAAPPLSAHFAQSDEPPPVWPDAEGSESGYALYPLYPSAPKAARKDERLYALLSLVDAIRDGRARERALAEKELVARLEDR